MRVDIRLLGGFDVVIDGAPVPDDAWRRQAPAALVKLLALARGHRLRREQVIDSLWPDLLIEEAAPRLHKAAHYARTALGDSTSVVLSGETVSLFPAADLVVDVDRFEAAAEAARTHGSSSSAAEAVEIYRGDLLPDDLYEPWTEEDRERLRLSHGEMLQIRGRWDLIVAADPLDETAQIRLVQDHVERGDRRAALRQLDLMERVWQRELGEALSAAALAVRDEALALPIESAPGARPAPSAPVPQPPTPTVGRDRDIERVVGMLETSRTVTLLGPGGVGKTRLAAEVAIRHSGSTSIESCFVDLTKVAEAGLVPGLITRELGVHVEAGGDMGQTLVEALEHRPLLLVLDNFEHVLDAAEFVPRLVQSLPDLRVLSTSRARLRVAGEQVYDVTPLSMEPVADESGPPDAITLFGQAAEAVDPAFDLTLHLADVASICRAVDGLPLAIELAAGHVRTLPPSLLLARLGARLESTSGGSRGAPERQQTVPATIDWSLRLVGDAERDLFTRLGVFAGPVPLEVVEGVCGEPGADVVELLSRLVDHSLVRRVTDARGVTRFVLLELLRERAGALLLEEADLADDLARRHAAYLADFLDDLDERRWGEASSRWIEDITALHTEIRAAHAWAVSHAEVDLASRLTVGLGTYWHREGHQIEGREWVQEALTHGADLDEYVLARLHIAAGFVAWTHDQPLGRRHWEEAVRRFRELGHDRYLAYSLALTSATYEGDPDHFESAVATCEEAIALARAVGERPLLAQALNILGELTRVAGDDRAVDAYAEGLELATAADDHAHMAMFLGNLGDLAEQRGDFEESHRLCLEGVRLSWSHGHRLVAAMVLMQLARPQVGRGRPEDSALFLAAGEKAMRRLGVGMQPGYRVEHVQIVAGLREKLGDEALQRLTAEGAALSLDQAVALALAEDDDLEG